MAGRIWLWFGPSANAVRVVCGWVPCSSTLWAGRVELWMFRRGTGGDGDDGRVEAREGEVRERGRLAHSRLARRVGVFLERFACDSTTTSVRTRPVLSALLAALRSPDAAPHSVLVLALVLALASPAQRSRYPRTATLASRRRRPLFGLLQRGQRRRNNTIDLPSRRTNTHPASDSHHDPPPLMASHTIPHDVVPPTKASLKTWWNTFTFAQRAKKEAEENKGESRPLLRPAPPPLSVPQQART